MSKAKNYIHENGVFEYNSQETAEELLRDLMDEENYSIEDLFKDLEIVYSGKFFPKRKATRHKDVIVTESEQVEEKLEALSEEYLEERS